MVARLDQTFSGRARPPALAARLIERIAHRRELIGDPPRSRLVELGALELVPRNVDEPRRHGAARRCPITATTAASDRPDEGSKHRSANHPAVFRSTGACVKPARRV